MRLFELIKQSYKLRDSLRPKYAFLLFSPWIVLLVALMPLWWASVARIAHALGLPDDAPVKGHPSEVAFFFSMFAALLVWVALTSIAYGVLTALFLRYVAGWDWSRIWQLLYESRAPEHWIRPASRP